jgi:hypothetical protein
MPSRLGFLLTIPCVTTNNEISRWSHGVLEYWKSIIPQLHYSRKGITNRDDAVSNFGGGPETQKTSSRFREASRLASEKSAGLPESVGDHSGVIFFPWHVVCLEGA